MLIVPLFFAVFAKSLRAEAAHMGGCGLDLQLPPEFVVRQTGESLRAETMQLPRWTLVAYCKKNEFRTDRSRQLQGEFRNAGDLVRNVRFLETNNGIPALVLRRTPARSPVPRIEAWIFTRNLVHHFVLVPDHARAISQDEWKKKQDAIEAVVESAESADPPAISEEAYRVRLAGAIAAGMLIPGLIAWILLRKIFLRRKTSGNTRN